ncbi:MAG: hypothetical protein VX258_11280 [Pseudomonadota bacterium]|nr:hypothetical protein [Pseudomonadota bacterium]
MAAAPKPLRNWAAIDPLMRKGGAHQAPKKQTRPKLDWRDALDDFEDWQDEASGDNVTGDNEGAEAPSFFGRSAAAPRFTHQATRRNPAGGPPVGACLQAKGF